MKKILLLLLFYSKIGLANLCTIQDPMAAKTCSESCEPCCLIGSPSSKQECEKFAICSGLNPETRCKDF